MMRKFLLLIVILAITIIQGYSENVALNKTTASSSGDNSALAVDGNTGTRWESSAADPQWISIDLGQAYNISEVVLVWETAYASAYQIEISDDNSSWTSIYSTTTSDGGTDDITLSGSGRYIRMYGSTRATIWGYSIYEFEVYGTVDSDKDATLSALKVNGTALSDFSSSIFSYSYGVADPSTVPSITATPSNSNANVVTSNAVSVPGTASVNVTAVNSNFTQSYTVYYYASAPTQAAPTPTKSSADVISVYSDAYTSIYTDLNPSWGQATSVSVVQIESNNTLQYSNLNYQGMNYTTTDVTGMDYLHVDYFTGNATALSIYLIGSGENAYNIATDGGGIVLGQWVSLDIPLTHYTSPNLSAVYQFKTEGNGTVYLDNFYFWKEPATPAEDASLSDIKVDGVTLSDFVSTKKSYTVNLPYGTTTVPTVTATATQSGATVTVTKATSLPGTTTISVESTDQSTTEEYSVYFIANIPGQAATDPTNNDIDVISIYSDTYTCVDANTNPNWGQSTEFEEIQIGDNNILKYGNLNYQGLEFTSSDVSGMEYVHLDYWTVDATAFEFYLIASGENSYNIATEDGITSGQWVGVDIPLSHYSDAGRDLTAAIQFKTTGNGTIYLDNLYFWKQPTVDGSDATLSDLAVDGTTIASFNKNVTSYTVDLTIGTTIVPTVTATTYDPYATYSVTKATSIPGSTSVIVTAGDQTTTKTYTINFIADLPATAAPTPTTDASRVISVYSDAYTSIATNLNPGWGQTTKFSEIQIEGNNTLKYGDLNYQGTDYSTTDVSAMEYIHVDYFTLDATAFQFFLIATGETYYDINTELGITTGEWVSIDIPMSTYDIDGIYLNAAYQFKVVGNGTIYLDNLYFWKDLPGTDASLSDLKVDGGTLEDFATDKYSYSMELAYGTTTIPTVTATATDKDAELTITPTTVLPGTTTIDVTSEDGMNTLTYTVEFTLGEQGGDATLKDLQVSGTTISGFSPNVLKYTLELPHETTEIPLVTAFTNDDNAMLTVSPTTELPGTTQVKVVSENQLNTKIYSVNFVLAPDTDASLSDLLVDNVTIDGFSASTFEYTIILPTGTTVVPVITAVTSDENASLVITAASSLPGATKVVVTAEDGSTKLTYTINFQVINSISQSEVKPEFKLYPNPATDVIYLQADTQIDNIEIYNTMGSLVLRTVPTSDQINVSDFNRGVYFVRMSSQGIIRTVKFIKQ